MAVQQSSKKRIWKTIAGILAVFLLLAVIGHATGWIGGNTPGHEVETSRVSERDITRIVTATGRIQPEVEMKIAPDVSGEIVELYVREGDFVYEGDVLLRIRPDIIQARLDVERGERVVGSIQMAGTEMLHIARMEQMEVSVNVNENDIVYVSENDTARIEVDAYPGHPFVGIVTEIANSAITRGDGTAEQITEYPVKIRILSLHNTGLEYGGKAGRQSEEVRLQDSDVVVDMVPARFKPGMTATVDVETLRETSVLSVPLQAVTMRDYSLGNTDTTAAGREDLRRVVFRVSDGIAERVEVETGISDDRYIHVLPCLQPNDEIVSGNYRILSRVLEDGDAVRVQQQSGTAAR